MKLSFYGKAMHFYMWFGQFALKITIILMFTLLISLTLVLSVSQLAIHKVGFEISHFVPLAIAQTIVGITLLASMAVGVAFELPAGIIALFEIPIEVSLKKRVSKIVKEKQKISMAELASATGVLESDLSFLLKNWLIRPGHLQFDIDAQELSWQG